MAVKPSPLRIKRLRALGHVHAQFVRANQDAPFRPESRPDSKDYNLHYVDLEAGDAEAEFARRGRAIVRGELDDQLDDILAS